MRDTKPNFAAFAKRYNCDYCTVKRYYELGLENKLDSLKQGRKPKPSLLDGFRELIIEKLSFGCSAKSIYYLICKKGYSGSYTTVKRFCRKEREDKMHKATIRIETSPGLSAQVDWKESVRMISRHEKVFIVNLFLYVLGYSRMKYLQLTVDRKQKTVFECLHQAFFYTGSVPEEIWFDNMKPVVDRGRSQFTRDAFNETFNYFSKDAGFKPIACRPFRPQTKGKVEALARTMNRLQVFNHEFTDLDDLEQLVKELNYDLNFEEIFQGTFERPVDRWSLEKENLKRLNLDHLQSYYEETTESRNVSKEAIVIYNYQKYSVPISYIGKTVTFIVDDGILRIYDGETMIRAHPLSKKSLNYHRDDYVDVLQSDVFKHLGDEELERFVDENLESCDYL